MPILRETDYDIDFLEAADAAELSRAYASRDLVMIQAAELAIGNVVDCLDDTDICPRRCRCLCDLCEN